MDSETGLGAACSTAVCRSCLPGRSKLLVWDEGFGRVSVAYEVLEEEFPNDLEVFTSSGEDLLDSRIGLGAACSAGLCHS